MFYHASWFQRKEATVNESTPTEKPNVQEYSTPIAVLCSMKASIIREKMRLF